MSSNHFMNGTLAVHGGEERAMLGAAQVPIFQSAAFAYADVEAWQSVALGTDAGHIYSRNSNPTVGVFEEKVRLLERAAAATSFSSGMAAISNTLFALLRPGDRVVSVTDTYGGTSKIFLDFLPEMGIKVDLVDTGDHAKLDAAIAQGCKVVYLETPTNPTLKIVDLRRAIAAAQRVKAITVVDNTFATPINQQPISLGADLVVHSATKFLGGHDDAMGGILAGRSDLVPKVHHYREINGACLSAMSAYLLLRGLKTLELRVARQNATALSMATFLRAHRSVESVFYPGLESHRDHAIAASQMSGYGGVLSFALKGGSHASTRFLNALQLAQRAASLGSVNTLAGPPRTTSHVECSPEERARLGIPESLVRYSCGIENFEDLRADVDQALSHA
ncbi:MAG: cystathionine gamma-synthase family protein [Sinobacteraceae bacterium]|nr:cystathionine gamma-synthase family protein [Nevskiaceae bacterium]